MLLADTPAALQCGHKAGCHEVQALELSGSPPTWPDAGQVAARIARLLAPDALLAAAVTASSGGDKNDGEQEQQQQRGGEGGEADAGAGGEELDSDETVDMVVLALDAQHAPGSSGGARGSPASAAPHDSEEGAAPPALAWVDELVRELNACPGLRQCVMLSLVLAPSAGAAPSPGLAPLPQTQPLLQLGAGFLPLRRPRQSYQAAGLDAVEVEAGRPMLVVHRLAGVVRCTRFRRTRAHAVAARAGHSQDPPPPPAPPPHPTAPLAHCRQDALRRLVPAEVQAQGGAGCCLAERLLPEVAYKLGRAPKYGA